MGEEQVMPFGFRLASLSLARAGLSKGLTPWRTPGRCSKKSTLAYQQYHWLMPKKCLSLATKRTHNYCDLNHWSTTILYHSICLKTFYYDPKKKNQRGAQLAGSLQERCEPVFVGSYAVKITWPLSLNTQPVAGMIAIGWGLGFAACVLCCGWKLANPTAFTLTSLNISANDEGWADFRCSAGSVSVWVPQS